MNKDIVYRYNLIYLFIIIVWPVIKINFLDIDGAGRIESAFTLLAIIVNFQSFFHLPKAMYFWLIWIAYCVVSIHYKGFGIVDYPFLLWLPHNLLMPMVAMVVVYKCALYNYQDIIKTMFIYLLIYALVGTIIMFFNRDAIKADYLSNTVSNDQLNSMIILFPIAALCKKAKIINTLVLFSVTFMILFGIILSGERKAIAGLFLMIIGYFLSKNPNFNFRSFLLLGFIALISYFTVFFFLANSLAGERLDESLSSSEFQDNLFLKILGDRALMYVEGFDFFLENPITGLGLTNFINHSIIALHILHTEYMVQLAECGIIGTFLFLLFFGSMIVKIVKLFFLKIEREQTMIYAATLASILMIAFTAWIYDCLMYFVFYGFLLSFYDRVRPMSIQRKRINKRQLARIYEANNVISSR